MALGKNLWRPFPCDAWEWLQDHEPLAQRLLLWMWTGPDSTASGLLRLREYSAAGALKSKPAAIRKALDELAKDGRLFIGATASGRHDVWLDSYLSSQTGIKSDHRQLIRREIEAFADGLPKAQAIEDWSVWDAACRKAGDRQHLGSSQPEHTEQNRTEQKTMPIPIGIGAPAVAVDKPKRANARPTLDEAIAYFQEQGSTTAEATAFFDRNTAGGWLVGRNPMKDWRAAARTWLHNEAKWSKQGSYRGKPQAPGKLSGQYDVFSEAEMVKARKQMDEDTTPW
jgi:hypothetical protein